MLRPNVAPETVARFLLELRQLESCEKRASSEAKVAVAVSGGPDSLALLLLANAALPGRVLALTVDHGLRAESAAEAAMVASLCDDLGVEHRVLPVSIRKGGAANVQAEARAARYKAMAKACADAGISRLMTAHHADDQAETLIMRLVRGSGLAGLAGIRAVRRGEGVTILRPLLGYRKAELAQIVQSAGLVAVDDPSNRSPAYDRTAARALLTGASWLDPMRMAASAQHLAEAEAALQWTAEHGWRGRADVRNGEVLLDVDDLPPELVRRLVVMALKTLDPGAKPDGPSIQRLIARLGQGSVTTLCGIRVSPGRRWRFAAAPPRRTENRTVAHCS